MNKNHSNPLELSKSYERGNKILNLKNILISRLHKSTQISKIHRLFVKI